MRASDSITLWARGRFGHPPDQPPEPRSRPTTPDLTPTTALPTFTTLRDLALQSSAALLAHRDEPAPYDEHYLDLPALPFTCTIDSTGQVACYLELSDEAAARRFFRETVTMIESLTPGWEMESDATDAWVERYRYSRDIATVSVALYAGKTVWRVWVFFSAVGW